MRRMAVKAVCPLCLFFVSATTFWACLQLMRTHAFEAHGLATKLDADDTVGA